MGLQLVEMQTLHIDDQVVFLMAKWQDLHLQPSKCSPLSPIASKRVGSKVNPKLLQIILSCQVESQIRVKNLGGKPNKLQIEK